MIVSVFFLYMLEQKYSLSVTANQVIQFRSFIHEARKNNMTIFSSLSKKQAIPNESIKLYYSVKYQMEKDLQFFLFKSVSFLCFFKFHMFLLLAIASKGLHI